MRALLVALGLLVAPPPIALGQPSSYPTEALLASLRPAERATIVRDAELGALEDLPRYELRLELGDDLRSFELDETVHFTNRAGRPLGEVVLRIFANAVGEPGERPLVELIEGECLDGVSCATSQLSPSALAVRPERPLAPGARLRFRLRLRGRVRDIAPERASLGGQALESLGALSAGHGHGDYGLLAHSDGIASMTSFFPVVARLRGGMWEESDSSTMGDLGTDELGHVHAIVRTPAGVRVAASGRVSAPRTAGGRLEHEVHAGFVREWALVASGGFRSAERQVGEVTVRSWFLERDAQAGEAVLDSGARALALFQDRFGPYPYTELDLVEAPLVGGAGGMEQSGLVTLAMMLYRSASDASLGALGALGERAPDLEARRRSMLELVTAHEVAHQWWHGIVGSDSRRHPFQDECLAQWSAVLYVEHRHGAARARREADQQVAGGYHMMRLMGRPDAAVDQPVSAFPDALTYAGIVYGKGPYLYPALRSLLGDQAFFEALRDYVRAHRFRIAPPRALFERMARGPRAPRVRALVRRWLDETHGDADLGRPELPGMLGLDGNDPAAELLRGLLGQLGQRGAPGPAGDSSGPSPAELEELMRGLMQGLGGARP